MIELNSKIKNALIKIGFIERYEELSNKFNAKRTPSSNRLAYIDSEEVMETIQDLGYSPVFDIQVLSPGRKGELGTIALNQSLQSAVNPPEGRGVDRAHQHFCRAR